MTTDTWLLLLTALAAIGGITGLALLWFVWIDRPTVAWGMRAERPPVDEEVRHSDGKGYIVTRSAKLTERHEAIFSIHPEGTSPVFNVEIRPVGLAVLEASALFATRMAPGSTEPMRLRVMVPDESEGAAFIEIRWFQPRPHRHHAQRLNVHTSRYEYWRWSWRSLRRRGRRLARTRGSWVRHRDDECELIPATEVQKHAPVPATEPGGRQRRPGSPEDQSSGT